jgi:hypothetical protein
VRGPAWPGSASASAARAAHSLAQIDRRERARGAGAAWGGAARLHCGGDLTGAREAAGESMAGPHRRVDGGAARARGRR